MGDANAVKILHRIQHLLCSGVRVRFGVHVGAETSKSQSRIKCFVGRGNSVVRKT